MLSLSLINDMKLRLRQGRVQESSQVELWNVMVISRWIAHRLVSLQIKKFSRGLDFPNLLQKEYCGPLSRRHVINSFLPTQRERKLL